MRKSRFSEQQIALAVQQVENGGDRMDDGERYLGNRAA